MIIIFLIIRNRVFNVRWQIANFELITQWRCYCDEKKCVIYLNMYQKGNKLDVCNKLMKDNELNIQQLDFARHKVRNKITDMIKLFKKTKALTNSIKWNVDFTKHDVIVNNIRGETQSYIYDKTIKTIIFKKCLHYYEFENVMNDLFIIIFSFIIKFIRFDNDQFLHHDSKNNSQFSKTQFSQTQISYFDIWLLFMLENNKAETPTKVKTLTEEIFFDAFENNSILLMFKRQIFKFKLFIKFKVKKTSKQIVMNLNFDEKVIFSKFFKRRYR